MAQLVTALRWQVLDASGNAVSGAKAYFYDTGTLVPAVVCADAGLTTPLTQPVEADSGGYLPAIYMDTATTVYRCKLFDSLGVPLTGGDIDPVNADDGGLEDGSVTTPKLAAGAVTNSKIALGTIADDKLVDMGAGLISGRALGAGTGARGGLTPVQVSAILGLTGMTAAFPTATAPSGWLEAAGTTIGSATSGAGFADPTSEALFDMLWAGAADADLPILTSAGAGSTRGANAAADWAANKRMTLPDLRGEFVRGWDHGRGVDTGRAGVSHQVEMVGPHTHPIVLPQASNTAGPGTGLIGTATAGTSTPSTSNNTGTENRPRNVAQMFCIRL